MSEKQNTFLRSLHVNERKNSVTRQRGDDDYIWLTKIAIQFKLLEYTIKEHLEAV